jgi:hypothetical protein
VGYGRRPSHLPYAQFRSAAKVLPKAMLLPLGGMDVARICECVSLVLQPDSDSCYGRVERLLRYGQMVNWSLFKSLRSLVGCAATLGFLVLAGCQTPNPVKVDADFAVSPTLLASSPTVLSVLPVEDGTANGAVASRIPFFRQELNRQLVSRGYSSTTESWVDAAQIGAAPIGESILTPNRLLAMAKAGRDDAVVAVRIERWDEQTLMFDRKVRFRASVAMVGSDGTQLWSGSMQGSVKAGGAGAAPRGRDAAARSCVSLVVGALLEWLPERVVR